tara:strand:- start:2551 stop:4053 length:1503 start_codon:yes stop_codon:yes gene_type:complete
MEFKKGHTIKPQAVLSNGLVSFTDGTNNVAANQISCEAYGYKWDNKNGVCTAFNFSPKIKRLNKNITNTKTNSSNIEEGGTINTTIIGSNNTTKGQNKNVLITGENHQIENEINNASVLGGTYAKAQRPSEVVIGGGEGLGLNQTSIVQLAGSTSGWYNTKSLDFDGTNDYLDISGVDTTINTTTGTVSAWVKLDTIGVSCTIFMASADANNHIRMWYKNSDSTLRWTFYRGGTNNVINYSTTIEGDGNWHHVAMTWNTNDLKGYLDGTEVASGTMSGTWSGTIDTVHIGRYTVSSTSYWLGNIDEVTLFTSVANISTLYNSGTPNEPRNISNLIGYWRMGEGSTYPTIDDDSTNSFNGTMTNMVSGDIVTDVKTTVADTNIAKLTIQGDGTNYIIYQNNSVIGLEVKVNGICKGGGLGTKGHYIHQEIKGAVVIDNGYNTTFSQSTTTIASSGTTGTSVMVHAAVDPYITVQVTGTDGVDIEWFASVKLTEKKLTSETF